MNTKWDDESGERWGWTAITWVTRGCWAHESSRGSKHVPPAAHSMTVHPHNMLLTRSWDGCWSPQDTQLSHRTGSSFCHHQWAILQPTRLVCSGQPHGSLIDVPKWSSVSHCIGLILPLGKVLFHMLLTLVKFELPTWRLQFPPFV